MENENDKEYNLLDVPFFKLSYAEQKYKKSNEYKIWKKNLMEKNGQNGIEIFCSLDNIVIYTNQEARDVICPICKTNYQICEFCKKPLTIQSSLCCVRAFINDFSEKRKTFNLKDKDERTLFIGIFFTSFFPGLFNFFLAFQLYLLFIGKKEIMNAYLNIIFKIFTLLTILTISFVFIMFNYIFYLTLIIISIPLLLYPLKIYLGMFDFIVTEFD